MEQKFRVVKFEPSKSIVSTTSEALITTISTPKRTLETCKDGFTSKKEAENYQKVIEASNPYDYFEVESYS